MKMGYFKSLNFIILLVSIYFPLDAIAVTKNEENTGEVLLFPVVSMANKNTSLLTINNTDWEHSKALKIRVLSPEAGNIMLSFNLYLGAYDTWVAAIKERDGHTVITTPDNSCTIPDATGDTLLTIDGLIGSIEVFEMGVVDEKGLVSKISSFDCDSLVDTWTSGEWLANPGFGLSPPTGGLRGEISLINVRAGTLFSMQATALSGFSDIIQHTIWSNELPDLSSIHDAGTDNNATKSRLCINDKCFEDEWARPIDAVSASLLAHELVGSYVTIPGVAAQTEWVVNYPTRKFYESGEKLSSAHISLLVSDREANYQAQPCMLPIDDFSCMTSYILNHDKSLEVIDFNNSIEDEGSSVITPILGIEHIVEFPDDNHLPLFEAGNARVGFETSRKPTLISNSGRQYFGAPAIGISFEQYSNGFLMDESGNRVKASYGNTFNLTKLRGVQDE